MATHTAIEWTDATWNPVGGCSVHSPGCRRCYAMKLAGRRLARHPLYAGTTDQIAAGPVFNGRLTVLPDDHAAWSFPLTWRGAKAPKLGPGRKSMIFAGDMADVFHKDRPRGHIHRMLAVAALAGLHRGHIVQFLTKRADVMHAVMTDPETPGHVNREMNSLAPSFWCVRELDDVGGWPLKNVWLGVSAERQQEADERIPLLLQTPAAVRFVSGEPLLGPIDLAPYLVGEEIPGLAGNCIGWTPPLDWVIAGGESGPRARPMHPGWARALRDQCAAEDVPFFFKQWGEYAPVPPRADLPGRPQLVRAGDVFVAADGDRHEVEIDLSSRLEATGTPMRRVGKKAAGATLDGREHKEFPR